MYDKNELNMGKDFFSIRTGKNPNTNGFGINDICELFKRLIIQLRSEGYFD